ncbi:MAG: hypothetical protein LUI07_09505 [Lachnospiraceae bacterium]|nr:hypothetical protein [Lachnospiraceae bacterium]
MRYVVGIDGGGTKTFGILADTEGCVHACATTGTTNHQICGAVIAGKRLADLTESLLQQSRIIREDVGYLYMGLSGADRIQDILRLEHHLPESMKIIPHYICNDVWIAFAAGTVSDSGAVSISGTGHNAAVKTPDGRTFGINALKYPLGNAGGGRMITDEALHMAFRAWEHTGPETLLTQELPRVCKLPDSVAILESVYDSQYTIQYNWPIPRLVDELACRGDQVCVAILEKFGGIQGEILASLMSYANLTKGEIPVVMAGSIYQKTNSPAMCDVFCARVREVCPDAHFTIIRRPPCTGAVLMALKQMMPEATREMREKWIMALDYTLSGKGDT